MGFVYVAWYTLLEGVKDSIGVFSLLIYGF